MNTSRPTNAKHNLEGPWCSKKLPCKGPCCLKPDHKGECSCAGEVPEHTDEQGRSHPHEPCPNAPKVKGLLPAAST